ISRSAMSRSFRYAAQCIAVAPSACGALMSAFCCRSERNVALSPAAAASATGLAPNTVCDSPTEIPSATVQHLIPGLKRIAFVSLSVRVLHETGQRTRAVADALLIDPIQVQDAEQEIAARNRFGRIRQVTPAFQLPTGRANQNMRHVIMQVLIGIAHIGTVQNQGMV